MAMVTAGEVLPSDDIGGYPIQLAKVQPPVLRDETLERPRLLDWLRVKVRGRVVLLLADAGYGKTTLLADFSRRSRLRTLWYRLDDDDRDWAPFLHHLVAAGQEHDPSFAPATSSLLAQIGVNGPEREAVLDTFLRELPTIVEDGAILIFDDFHIVDDAVDVRHITRELLMRGPERLTIAIASRRMPTVPLARLRALGEVAELETDDLRFDATETARLFTETYGRQLEPDVLTDLAVRTEGWIASLHLVQAALRDRSPAEIRRFVRTLNGADHEMYDYLAEEVVGDLSEELQRFLMETSILQIVRPDLAGVVSGLAAPEVTRLTAAAERLTLLSRLSGGPRTHQRYHPLVREFLEARLRSTDGALAVADLHRRTAAAAAVTDWRTAAYHYREAGDTQSVLDTVAEAIPTIMGNGQYALAESFIGPIPPDQRPTGFDLILSRVNMQQGDYASAIASSQSVLDSDSTTQMERDHALLNLLTLSLNYGDGDRAISMAQLLLRSADPNLTMIAHASMGIVQSADNGNIEAVNRQLVSMARLHRESSIHYFAVSQLNLAMNLIAQDRPDRALAEANTALEVLEAGSAQVEMTAARMARGEALAMLGRTGEAINALEIALAGVTPSPDNEALAEAGELFDSFLGPAQANRFLDQIGPPDELTPRMHRLELMARCIQSIRRRDYDLATEILSRLPENIATHPGSEAARLVAVAYLAVARGDATAVESAASAADHAGAQGAHRWRRVANLLAALAKPSDGLSSQLVTIGTDSPQTLTFLADLVSVRLHMLDEKALLVVNEAANRHQERWRVALRAAMVLGDPQVRLASAQALEPIGEKQDVITLRAVAHESKRRSGTLSLGRNLARRLAARVHVEDLGRVTLGIGQNSKPGSEARRKVLATLCFLVSRPDMSATRDQVLDAMWPELDPDVAVNSLNQTLYFLRRVLEPDYTEDLSPGYVHHDSDVIWLDPILISSRSDNCRQLIRELPERPSPDDVARLVAAYTGRYALDFEYEEWASDYRDSLHAAYLEIVERSVSDDLASGHYSRGIGVARRALEVDPRAEHVEVSLLRLYRVAGAHAAAAEQYAHYAAVMRDDLGIDPPPLESL